MLQHLDALLSYLGLASLATASVYLGALGSFKLKGYRLKLKNDVAYLEPDSDDDFELMSERLSASDAVWFPVLGSVVLGGFYLAFKYFGDDWINKLMGYYFLLMGTACVWNCLTALAEHLPLPKTRMRVFNVRFRLTSLALLIPSIFISVSFFIANPKPALVANIIALACAHSALTTLKLDSARTGCVLLGGLFFYDIWWVFGTSVMVTVATGLDVPIKLLFPRSLLSLVSLVPEPKNPNMLLGLGDVVIPGTLVALAHRLDMHLAIRRGRVQPSSYFYATLIAYFVGLCAAFGAMHVFKTGQPALLYLSPACCLSFLGNAIRRDELTYVWSWEDGSDEAKLKKESDEKKEGKEDKAA